MINTPPPLMLAAAVSVITGLYGVLLCYTLLFTGLFAYYQFIFHSAIPVFHSLFFLLSVFSRLLCSGLFPLCCSGRQYKSKKYFENHHSSWTYAPAEGHYPQHSGYVPVFPVNHHTSTLSVAILYLCRCCLKVSRPQKNFPARRWLRELKIPDITQAIQHIQNYGLHTRPKSRRFRHSKLYRQNVIFLCSV